LVYALHRKSRDCTLRWTSGAAVVVFSWIHRLVFFHPHHCIVIGVLLSGEWRIQRSGGCWLVGRLPVLPSVGCIISYSSPIMDVWLIAQGQLSIVNYTCTYKVGHVIGSVIIAIAATNVALALFFKMRQKWNDSFWKRVGCALILAAAVSGMHWTAVTGTSYTPIPGQLLQASTTWTVIVVSVIVRANYYKF
jgi:hypothetical protein